MTVSTVSLTSLYIYMTVSVMSLVSTVSLTSLYIYMTVSVTSLASLLVNKHDCFYCVLGLFNL